MNIESDVLFSHLIADLAEQGLFFEEVQPWPDITPKQFAAHSLQHNILKKYINNVADDADSKALGVFLASDSACKDWCLMPESSKDEVLIGEFKRALYDFFFPNGEFLIHSLYDLLDRGRVGPGTSVGSRGTSFYAKLFSSELTCTNPLLYEMYRMWVEQDPNWTLAELNRIDKFGECSHVRGSRISFVPKKDTISRTICVEPSLNMFFQLGLEGILRDRIRNVFGISFEDQQEVNRELARVGSIFDSFATIDLSAASDSISLKMLSECLPREIVDILKIIRSQEVEIDGEWHTLSMVSSMGNGSTFPLETLLFGCVVFSCYRFHGIPVRRSHGAENLGNFGVFGDDIIVEKGAYQSVIRLLKLLGFNTNKEKTFVEGPFRESCGGDYFRGHNVRPVFIKDLSNAGTRYSAINNLNDWSARTGISLCRTVQYLLNSVKKNWVPFDENSDSGIRVPLSFIRPRRDANGSFCYTRYVAKSSSYRISDMRISNPRGVKSLIYNPEGLLLSFLHGSIQSSRIGVRLNTIHYRPRRAVTPSWDYCDPVLLAIRGIDWGRWNSATWHNLYR